MGNIEEFYSERRMEFYANRAILWKSYLGLINWIKLNLAGKNVLDIGSGQGNFLFSIADKITEGTGIDISKNMFDFAVKKRNKSNYSNIAFLNKDFRILVPEGKFDCIFSIDGVIPSILSDDYSPEQLFGAIGKMLKPDGKVLLEFYSVDNGPIERESQEKQLPDNVRSFLTRHHLLFDEITLISETADINERIYACRKTGTNIIYSLITEGDETEILEFYCIFPEEMKRIIEKSGFLLEGEFGISIDHGTPVFKDYKQCGYSKIWTVLLRKEYENFRL